MALGPDANNPRKRVDAEIDPEMARMRKKVLPTSARSGQISNKRYSSVNAV
jgi:hypothetical protein